MQSKVVAPGRTHTKAIQPKNLHVITRLCEVVECLPYKGFRYPFTAFPSRHQPKIFLILLLLQKLLLFFRKGEVALLVIASFVALPVFLYQIMQGTISVVFEVQSPFGAVAVEVPHVAQFCNISTRLIH